MAGRNGQPRGTGPAPAVNDPRDRPRTGRERAVDGLDAEIDDLDRRPRKKKRKGGGGMTEVALGLCLGALLLAIILIVLYVFGNP